MWHTLSSDQEMLRDMTARFLGDNVPLSRMRKDLRHDPAGFEPSYWTQGAELGWTSLLVDEDSGGVTGRNHGISEGFHRHACFALVGHT